MGKRRGRRWPIEACLAALGLLGATAARADAGDAAKLFDQIGGQPARLRVFLQQMPKGGDLHNHLWGAPYAEQLIDWAGKDGLCVSREKLSIVPPPCTEPGTPPANGIGARDPALYSALIESFSTRGRPLGLNVNDTSGHQDFFQTFDRFGPAAAGSVGRMIASVRISAAANALSYVEPMQNPRAVGELGGIALGKPFDRENFPADLARIESEIPRLLAAATAEQDAVEAEARRELNCDAAPASAPCRVEIRYQLFALRALPPAFVFGQLALAFALAERDPRFVGINIVAPEDGPVALADFDLHMRMFRFFKDRHPGVKLSLHAGELTLGLVRPAELRDHIRQSIEVAGATRIGHGVDIPYEADAPALLARMARDRIAVEINLTSNDTILGVKGAAHPLSLYRAAGVPVVLSTDDEGVSRSDMTNEYLRAATEQGLRYADLKEIARASLEYSFLPGESLWVDGRIGTVRAECRGIAADAPTPGSTCARILASSARAGLQWRLEGDYRRFEQSILKQRF